jgi:histidine triad (HIT) family protein
MSEDCVFCQIAQKQIPASIVYEDDEFLAFHDTNKQAPVHVLVIPKQHFPTAGDVTDDALMGRAIRIANEAAQRMKVDQSGYRLVINTRDDGGQTVYHVHVHVLGGRFLQWPPG